ncbi:class I SAM-dependent methyltransferase [Cytobacillus spongiae]|jgi:ubiquinone/menaquinone biosynthesis C-methylase UbiE|uniref:class I SAM-dependent DNA methyltransferase n=1 Tax=Cytobacillus spongiae TaxID=2901381 RepID=UPI001F47D2B8|nr:class I SAM-dependent methyltransferase [Cytobacillus spongiae]UII54948.1 class I SAM-dependent methyltransferase [Cytobacillus spongiae]
MSYGDFAYIYDELMSHVPYDQWVKLVKDKQEKYSINEGNQLLDLACGTGELSIRFANEGFAVTGIDLSEDMLAVAHSKAMEHQQSIQFLQQDMSELEGLDQFDIIGIFCDSLNYLQTEEQVTQTFKSVFNYLKDGGLFIFDVHSVFKVMQVFMNQTFALNDEEISYIWHSYQGEHPNSVEHDLTFFVFDEETGSYNRYDELHFQRTFPIQVYEAWLKEIGFELLDITADFENTPPQTQSERIFFTLRKRA